MPAQGLAGLAEAVRACCPGDPKDIERLKHCLAAALQACVPSDSTMSEAVLSCMVESFTATGDNGKAVLDDSLLELLPPMAELANHSAECARLLTAFCSLAVIACSPRDTITAFLEVLGNAAGSSSGPDSLQFACNLLLMLPGQVAKLSRRKAANAVECCVAAASLAEVHGQMLGGWSMNQLAQAAQQAAGGSSGDAPAATLQRLDTFLAANWQAYSEFAENMLQVAQNEADPEARQMAQQGLSTLILQLMQHLTALWPPPDLRMLALQILKDSGSAQLMPSTESVAVPAPMLGSSRQHSKTRESDSHAQEAVVDLLHVLTACGINSWQELFLQDSSTAAGAGLAALYSSMIEGKDALLTMPGTAMQTVQLAARWCCAVAEASDNNILATLKAIALLQLAAGYARHLADASTAAGSSPGAPQATAHEAPESAQPSAVSTVARQLLVDLQPCVTLLAGVISQAHVQALRSQAAVALQQVLQALPQRLSYACLQQLLAAEAPDGGVHPEVAALLVQEVRSLLANSTAGSCFTPTSCIHLVMPWLVQHGPAGWQAADTLPDKANAVCAALAVVRLGLLRSQAGVTAGSISADCKQQLQPILAELAAAVSGSLQALQTLNRVEQASTEQSSADGRTRVPGEALGSGQAVDAWLAVSRVQDVLDRVVELL